LSGALPVIAQSLKPLGFKPLSDAVTELQSSLREARTAIERGNTALTPLLHAADRRDRWRSLLFILIGTPVVAAAVGLVLTVLGAERIAQVSAFATGAAGFLATGASWVRKQAEWMSQRAKEIEQAQRVYDEALHEALADMADQTAKTEEELSLARQEYLQAQQRAERARREQDAARADLAVATTSRLLGRFIQDRAASTDYRKHLGVLAVVRQDFQQLSQLIEEENWRLSPSGGDDVRFDGRLKKITSLEEEAVDAETRINRIVLYIDDLDRCPPANVVAVLQAVHLLLAFPLFVVVVGVDARWISRSLETRYRELLHVGNVDAAGDVAQMFGVARSEDYLEKIFQIPLWLRSMDASSARRMVQGLLRKGTDPSSVGKDVERQATDVTNTDLSAPLHSGVTSNVSTSAVQQTDVAKPAQPTSDNSPPAAASKSTTTPSHVAPNLESLRIRDFELSAIDQLAPLLGRSPRALKRFVNLYRLIKAGLTPLEHDAFVRQSENALGDYAAVLFLLAVDTGLPRISRALFDVLLATNHDGQTDDMDVKQLIKELDGNAAAKTADWATLRAWLSERLLNLGSVRRLTNWVPRVSRYSFQAAHLEASREAPLRRKEAKKPSAGEKVPANVRQKKSGAM
jgi:KAP-like P-loop domain-containing protein